MSYKLYVENILKTIANSLYGLITKGLSNKTKYDHRTKTSIRMDGNELTNPPPLLLLEPLLTLGVF